MNKSALPNQPTRVADPEFKGTDSGRIPDDLLVGSRRTKAGSAAGTKVTVGTTGRKTAGKSLAAK